MDITGNGCYSSAVRVDLTYPPGLQWLPAHDKAETTNIAPAARNRYIEGVAHLAKQFADVTRREVLMTAAAAAVLASAIRAGEVMAESSPSNSGIQEKDKDGPPAYLLSLDPPDGYSDPDGMRHYAQTVKEIVESFGGIYLVRHHKTRVVEGDWDPLFMVLIRFPSMSKLDAFYDSDLYRPWRELRKKAGRTSIVVAEG